MGKLVCIFGLLAMFVSIHGDKDATTKSPITSATSTNTPVSTPTPTAKTSTSTASTSTPTASSNAATISTSPFSSVKASSSVASTPHTTASPKPHSFATNNGYIVKDANNKTCLRANMTVQFVKHWLNGTKVELERNVTKDAYVDVKKSSCSKLVVIFEKSFGNNSFTLVFKNDSSFYYLNEILAYIDKEHINASNLNIGKTSIHSSYLCSSGFNVTMSDNATFVGNNIQFQAFGLNDGGNYGAATTCKSDLSPIIPIVVGSVLALLVLIVIIAYLIGRRRSRSGYEEI